MYQSQRRYGLDLLKILSMGMIFMHHMLTHGGLLFAFPDGTASQMGVELLNMLLFCAANVYALISGYVLSAGRFRLSRLMALWLQVFLTGLCITAGFALFSGVRVGWKEWLTALLPVIRDEYWYFTAYFGVFLLSPALNHLLNTLGKRQLVCLLGTLGFLFCIVPLFGHNQTLTLGMGYHLGWIAALYLLGGWLRLHGCGHLRRLALPLYLLCVLLSWLIPPLQQYVSPAMAAAAVCLLCLFENLQLPPWLQRVSLSLSPLTFGVYLLHDHPLVREHLMKMRFAALNQLTPPMLILTLLGSALAVYAVCLCIEAIRAKLFSLLRIRLVCERLEDGLKRFTA